MMRIMRLASLRRPRSNVVTSSARSRSTGSPMTRMSLRASRSRRLSSTWSRSLCLVCVMSLWYLSSRSQPLRVHVGDEPHAPRGEPVAVGSEPAAQGVESFPCFGSLNHDPAGVATALSPQRAGAQDTLAVSQSRRETLGREPPGDADLVLRRPGELEADQGPGPLWRERGRHACRIVVKTAETGNTLDTLRGWLGANRDRFAARGVRLVPDVDPQWL